MIAFEKAGFEFRRQDLFSKIAFIFEASFMPSLKNNLMIAFEKANFQIQRYNLSPKIAFIHKASFIFELKN